MSQPLIITNEMSLIECVDFFYQGQSVPHVYKFQSRGREPHVEVALWPAEPAFRTKYVKYDMRNLVPTKVSIHKTPHIKRYSYIKFELHIILMKEHRI